MGTGRVRPVLVQMLRFHFPVSLPLRREERVPCYLPQEWLALNSHATTQKSMTFTRVPLVNLGQIAVLSNNPHRPLAIQSLSLFELYLSWIIFPAASLPVSLQLIAGNVTNESQ